MYGANNVQFGESKISTDNISWYEKKEDFTKFSAYFTY